MTDKSYKWYQYYDIISYYINPQMPTVITIKLKSAYSWPIWKYFNYTSQHAQLSTLHVWSRLYFYFLSFCFNAPMLKNRPEIVRWYKVLSAYDTWYVQAMIQGATFSYIKNCNNILLHYFLDLIHHWFLHLI